MTTRVRNLLRSAVDCLPPEIQSRLRARSRAYWEYRQRRDMARRRRELLIAPQFPQYAIGPHSCGKPRVASADTWGSLTIGDYCSIAEGVTILLGNEHGTGWVTTYPFYALWPHGQSLNLPQATKGDVVIGNDVWIGQDSLVLSGSSIGDGAVIGAGSVVRGRIPPYAVAVGNPCRTVMYRFKPDDIAVLRALRWWEWPEHVVAEALPLLLSDDIAGLESFAQRHPLVQHTLTKPITP